MLAIDFWEEKKLSTALTEASLTNHDCSAIEASCPSEASFLAPIPPISICSKNYLNCDWLVGFWKYPFASKICKITQTLNRVCVAKGCLATTPPVFVGCGFAFGLCWWLVDTRPPLSFFVPIYCWRTKYRAQTRGGEDQIFFPSSLLANSGELFCPSLFILCTLSAHPSLHIVRNVCRQWRFLVGRR